MAFVPEWDFDFKVIIPTHIVSTKPGNSVSTQVLVKNVRGEPRSIHLTVGNQGASGVSARIVPSRVESGGTATLVVGVSSDASPGRYQFTVRGELGGTATFKTSNDTFTVIVEKEREDESDKKESKGHEAHRKQTNRPQFFAKARPTVIHTSKSRTRYHPRPVRWLAPILLTALFVAVAVPIVLNLTHYLSSTSSPGATPGPGIETYVGSSTFCAVSIIGNPPECATANDAVVNIDSNGNVLGPVLFGKITSGSFTGEAHTQSGDVFPMTGTFSNGILTAQHRSSSGSVTWTIILHHA